MRGATDKRWSHILLLLEFVFTSPRRMTRAPADYIARLSGAAAAAEGVARGAIVTLVARGGGGIELIEPVSLAVGTRERPVVIYNPLAWELTAVSELLSEWVTGRHMSCFRSLCASRWTTGATSGRTRV